MKITAWRIIKARHRDRAFSGEGARIAGGRWNKIGIPMIYTADSLALAALEIIVHLSRQELLKKIFFCIPARFDANLVTALDPAELPEDWNALPPSESTRAIGTEWALKQTSTVLKVASTVIPQEFNYVINPLHPDFNKIAIGTARRLALDPRLKV